MHFNSNSINLNQLNLMTGMMEMDSILSNITIKTITNKTTTKETQLNSTIKTTILMGSVKGIHHIFNKTKCVLKKKGN